MSRSGRFEELDQEAPKGWHTREIDMIGGGSLREWRAGLCAPGAPLADAVNAG
jgi:hypothetical protein